MINSENERLPEDQGCDEFLAETFGSAYLDFPDDSGKVPDDLKRIAPDGFKVYHLSRLFLAGRTRLFCGDKLRVKKILSSMDPVCQGLDRIAILDKYLGREKLTRMAKRQVVL